MKPEVDRPYGVWTCQTVAGVEACCISEVADDDVRVLGLAIIPGVPELSVPRHLRINFVQGDGSWSVVLRNVESGGLNMGYVNTELPEILFTTVPGQSFRGIPPGKIDEITDGVSDTIEHALDILGLSYQYILENLSSDQDC